MSSVEVFCDDLPDGSDDQIRLVEHDGMTAHWGDDVGAIGWETGKVILQGLPGGIEIFPMGDDHQGQVP